MARGESHPTLPMAGFPRGGWHVPCVWEVCPTMNPVTQPVKTARPRWLLFALFTAALGAVLFHPVGGFGFLNWDDDIYLERNPWLREGLSWKGIGWAFKANLMSFSKFAEYWSPVTLLTRLGDAQFFGINAGAMHVTSAVLHTLNALLLGAALHSLTRTFWRPAIVAVLFLVHPMNVEPVAWLSARKDLVAASFLFLTLLAYARYSQRPTRGNYVLLLGAFVGALMSKPMAVSIPVLLVILDWWPLARWAEAAGDRAKVTKLVAEKLPLFILAGLAALLAIFSQVDVGAMGGTGAYPWSARVTNALFALATYVRRTFWPDDLALFYPHTDGRLSWLTVCMCIASLVAITAMALVLARRQRFVMAGWLWFLTGIGPVLGLVQVGRQAMADRYFYTPGIGLLIAVVWGAHALPWMRWRGVAERLLPVGATAALALVASRQLATWRDSGTAFSHAVSVTKGNYIAHGSLAAHLFVRGELEPARAHCIASLQMVPLQPTAWNNLGAIEAALGHEDAALRAYERAVLLDPNSAKASFHFGELLARKGQTDAAVAMLRRAGELEPRWDAPRAALAAMGK